MFFKGLSAEARQALAHDVNHRLGGPAVPAIVEKREGQNLTIYRRYVPSQRNNVVRGARFCVEIPLGWGVPHTTFEELRVARNGQRRMQPRPPRCAMRITQQLDLGA